jgi:hypothetical protein
MAEGRITRDTALSPQPSAVSRPPSARPYRIKCSTVCLPSRNLTPSFASTASCSSGNRTSIPPHSATAAVAEWGGMDVRFPLEQDAVLAKDGVRFLDGRQTTMHLIR